mgnify:CR=1 FL=1|tara:strand:+ start:2220 stop:2765 length:546 start_codon:yes stop_codon:yes gene_type:complete
MSQLKVNSIVPVNGLPSGATGGGIIQCVQTVKKNTFSESLSINTFSGDTGLNVSITPQSNSNKVLIMASVVCSLAQDNDVIAIALFKGGSKLTTAAGDSSGNRVTVGSAAFADSFGGEIRTIPYNFIDSPATTSATTYGIRLGYFGGGSSSTVHMNRTESDDNSAFRVRGISSITAFEISV